MYVLYFARVKDEVVREIKRTRLTGRKVHAERLSVPNRSRERYPSTLVLESNADTH